MDKYQSQLNSIIYLINECYKSHPMKYIHSVLKGTESWEENGQEHCCLLTSFAIWPLAFSLPSHAHCLFCPLLLSKWELISMLRSHVAIKLYLHRYRRGAFSQIICSHGDCRAVLRLICFLKTKLEIQILCYRHRVSMPLYTPCLSLLSVCFVGYFHRNAARLTMWVWYQLLLLSDSPWVLDGDI